MLGYLPRGKRRLTHPGKRDGHDTKNSIRQWSCSLLFASILDFSSLPKLSFSSSFYPSPPCFLVLSLIIVTKRVSRWFSFPFSDFRLSSSSFLIPCFRVASVQPHLHSVHWHLSTQTTVASLEQSGRKDQLQQQPPSTLAPLVLSFSFCLAFLCWITPTTLSATATATHRPTEKFVLPLPTKHNAPTAQQRLCFEVWRNKDKSTCFLFFFFSFFLHSCTQPCLPFAPALTATGLSKPSIQDLQPCIFNSYPTLSFPIHIIFISPYPSTAHITTTAKQRNFYRQNDQHSLRIPLPYVIPRK